MLHRKSVVFILAVQLFGLSWYVPYLPNNKCGFLAPCFDPPLMSASILFTFSHLLFTVLLQTSWSLFTSHWSVSVLHPRHTVNTYVCAPTPYWLAHTVESIRSYISALVISSCYDTPHFGRLVLVLIQEGDHCWVSRLNSFSTQLIRAQLEWTLARCAMINRRNPIPSYCLRR